MKTKILLLGFGLILALTALATGAFLMIILIYNLKN